MCRLSKVIGLEIHAQIATASKLFSRAKVIDDIEAEPNSAVAFLDAGMPGSLPVPNAEAIDMALKTALALGMHINEISIFDRKHYFYQDSPLGYQISQFYHPIGLSGVMHCSFGPVRINRLHIESDAGKSVYEGNATLVDLNRVGVPLMEIVTEPDFENEEQVVEFLKELRSILLTLGTCKCNMSEGNLRADVNLSLHKKGEPYGTRVEIKNLNSFRFIGKAIEYETEVQRKTLESGGTVVQETKLFDSKLGITKSMRDKEDYADYRYFADPDLLPIKLTPQEIADAKAKLPELPQATRARYMQLGVGAMQSYTLTEHPVRKAFFDEVIAACLHGDMPMSPGDMRAHIDYAKLDTGLIQKASNWICSELIGRLTKLDLELEDFLLQRKDFGSQFMQIVRMCDAEISRVNGKELLDTLVEAPCDVLAVAKAKGMLDKVDNESIKALIKKTIESQPDEVNKYKAGKVQIVMYFVGQVMKELKGKCDPEFVRQECLNVLNQL